MIERRHALSLVLVMLTLTLGCGGPLLTLPGGALEGSATAAPSDWSFTDDVNTVQLETRPADPYSVNIWVITLDEHLYVHAGTNRAAWVEHIEADPNVRVQVADSVYELAAARVEGQDEFDRFSDGYEKKYGRRPGNENAAEAYVFRLAAR
jgi:hypothetical protein